MTPHLKHPRELLVGLLLRSRCLRRGVRHPLLIDGQEAQVLGDGLQVGAVVHHGPIGLHHDLREHTLASYTERGTATPGSPITVSSRGGGLDLLEVGRDGSEGEDLEA